MSDTRNWFPPVAPSRQRRLPNLSRQGTRIVLHGHTLHNFASNDYLGLGHHPALAEAARRALARGGFGSGASRLISGDDDALHALEAALAAWLGFEAALVVGSGMLANIGLLQTLADRHTHLFTDRLNHASLVDGARLSGGQVHRYRHDILGELADLLERHPAERRLLVSDGVFSMDGDGADVASLVALAEQHDAIVVIDDAHGIGTMGPDGRGLVAAAQLSGHPRLVMIGTFGKAFGSYGAFILGTRELIAGLVQRLRTLIYSTALPPLIPAASLAALQLIQEGHLVAQLQARIAFFRRQARGLPLPDSASPIQPLLVGGDAEALQLAAQLVDAGFYVPAIRPPTVPEGTARLRITLSAAHSEADIASLVTAIHGALA
jgi:8-amino-7-oxononanoate synthase